MIHFHGGPITPDTCALKAWKGRHAFISFANAGQLALASEVTQSFALDNGAFSFWTKNALWTGTSITGSSSVGLITRGSHSPLSLTLSVVVAKKTMR